MKRTGVFLLFFLLLVVSVSGTAFAGRDWSAPTPEVIILVCQETPPSFTVYAVDNASTVTSPPAVGADCAAALVTLKEDKFVIRNVQALGTPPAAFLIYTLVSGSGW